MAKARDRPRLLLVDDDKKVAIPSGMLCMMIASMETRPMWYSFLFLIFSFDSGISLSIKREIMIPVVININNIIRAGKGLNMVFKSFKLSGIKSFKETKIITPLAKAREVVIIFCSFFKLNNKGISPKRVEIPAIEDKIKA